MKATVWFQASGFCTQPGDKEHEQKHQLTRNQSSVLLHCVISPHNQDVIIGLQAALAIQTTSGSLPLASCQTYFETFQKSYMTTQKENLEKQEEDRITTHKRQGKKTLS
jgi:hypothetical protein